MNGATSRDVQKDRSSTLFVGILQGVSEMCKNHTYILQKELFNYLRYEADLFHSLPITATGKKHNSWHVRFINSVS